MLPMTDGVSFLARPEVQRSDAAPHCVPSPPTSPPIKGPEVLMCVSLYRPSAHYGPSLSRLGFQTTPV